MGKNNKRNQQPKVEEAVVELNATRNLTLSAAPETREEVNLTITIATDNTGSNGSSWSGAMVCQSIPGPSPP